jgi:hypothetical protein
MEAIDLRGLEKAIAALSEEDLAELDATLADELAQPFIPNPGPQTQAMLSEADILLYGGAAGGGKSALEIGAFFRDHYSGLILRREAIQLDGLIEFCKQIGEPEQGHYVGGNENVFKRNDGGRLKFAGLNQADDWRKHAGNARDFMAFDEAGEFLRDQVFSLIGWLRSTRPGQRCRVILGSNPPRGGDGAWLIEEFAPWLDPMFVDPALPGELRWAIVVGSVTEWVGGPGEYLRGNEWYEAMSRTFIPAKLDDNPYLRDTKYRATLQGLPEPLRSQLLYGDFLAGREDHEWQVIPTQWVKAAQARWAKAAVKRRRMLALSADIAIGGRDNLVIGSLHTDNWFAPLEAIPGIDVKNSIVVSNHMLRLRRDNADMSVDLTGGWGEGAKTQLEENQGTPCHGIVYSSKSGARTYDGSLGFCNLRAEMVWKMREALDPEGGTDEKLLLPPDPRLEAELTSYRWIPRGTDILIESKDEQKKRIGSSPDRGDTVIQLWHRKDEAVYRAATVGRGGIDQQSTVAPDTGILDW